MAKSTANYANSQLIKMEAIANEVGARIQFDELLAQGYRLACVSGYSDTGIALALAWL